MKINTAQMIVETTEEYIEEYQREITLEKDGLLAVIIASLPFTETTIKDGRTVVRVVKRVEVKTLKANVKEEASQIIQSGVKRAEETAKKHYVKLREKMMEEFQRIGTALENFNADLNKKLRSKQDEGKKLKQYEEVLDWVKRFHERLKHILDLEAK